VETCQEEAPHPKVTTPHSRSLPRRSHQTKLAVFSAGLGILIIGTKKEKDRRRGGLFPLGEEPPHAAELSPPQHPPVPCSLLPVACLHPLPNQQLAAVTTRPSKNRAFSATCQSPVPRGGGPLDSAQPVIFSPGPPPRHPAHRPLLSSLSTEAKPPGIIFRRNSPSPKEHFGLGSHRRPRLCVRSSRPPGAASACRILPAPRESNAVVPNLPRPDRKSNVTPAS
jgi:hypothetical protein